MDLKTFQAPTMSAALAEVKSTLGPSAVILHTRTFYKRRWLGLRRQEVVEITASRGLKQDRPAPRKRPAPPLPLAPQRRDPITLRSANSPAGQLPDNSRDLITVGATASARARDGLPTRSDSIAFTQVRPKLEAEARHQLLQTPAAQNAQFLSVAQEMTSLRSMVKELVDHSRREKTPQVPEELFEFYSQLIQNQVAQELATDIIKTLQRQIRPEHIQQTDFVRDKLTDQIERLLPSAGPIIRTKSVGPHVVALIGPTGVGKTTTIAKLAANLKIRDKRRVGLITIDTYRIAAVDQLRKYADIIGSPLKVVGTPEDLAAAVKSMSDCEYVLIDTAGRSPNDALKLNELKTFLTAANPDEVHLVLSSTASQQCVELAISRFADVRMDKIIFTKLDEAAHLGVVLNVIHKVNKSLSYVTTGQDVPDDIEVGKGKRLAQLILGTTPQ